MYQERYAIVGYGFRMPGGIHTGDGFWQLLNERGFVREPVAGRYGRGYEPVGDPAGPGRFGSGYEGLMRGDEPYLFDCHLFGVSAREASVMDPQLRMLLTCTWEAFERAGWDHARLRDSRTGVFVGAQVSASGNWRPLHGPNEFMVTGTSLDMLPNRISYAFNLTGPSATYMTACSSGATALHAAVAALDRGDCDQAVVGASSYLGSAQISAGFARLGVISPDGGCRSFDATANGYMRAEGVFVYLVKPLMAAEADGDRILAVIAGTAVNTAGSGDGTTGAGPGRMITAPTRHAQVALMRAACSRAGLFPREVDYLEAHATGTRVGDRIEGNAIGQVFGGPGREVPLRVASVKSNVGHMEAAAFGCALLKVLLMFEHRTYAPVSTHFTVPNPDIDFTGLRVQTECEPFGEGPVAVGINSFGFGGANGHCLLTEYQPKRPAAYPAPAPDAAYLVPLSARSPEALRQTARELGELAGGGPGFGLHTLAGNLSTRRTHFATRTAFAVTSLTDLAGQLREFAGAASAVPRAVAPVATVAEGGREPRVLMVFAGQGTQWAGCGRELYASEPVFRAAVDAVDAVWRELAGFSLRAECFGAPQERLDECQLAQPVIFMIEVALTELLRSWGVRPSCVTGHSAGEVAAAYAADIYTLEEATRLIFNRAVQQQRTAGSGRMLAVGLDLAGTEAILRELAAAAPSLEIACENAPASTVACGSAADVALAVSLLEERGVTYRLLRGNVAFHSRAMDVIEGDLRDSLAFLDSVPMTAAVPFVSSVTGTVTENLDSAYWWSNVRRPVRFAAAIETAVREFHPDLVVEVAPSTALLPAVRQCLDHSAADIRCVPTLSRGADSRLSFHEALGALYLAGVPLDFAARYPRVRPVSHLLPPHPKDERTMMDPLADDTFFLRRGDYSAGPLLGRLIPGDRPRFEVRMSAADFPWLADHRVQNTSIMPAAGYIEMVLEALGGAPAHFAEVEFRKPCVLTSTPVRLQTELEPEPGQQDAFWFRVVSSSYTDDVPPVLHCTGKVRRLPAAPAAGGLGAIDRSRFAAGRFGGRKAFYEQMSAVIGEYFQYGPNFQVVHGTLEDPRTKELLLDIRVGAGLWRDSQRAGYLLAPPLLDGGLQALLYYMMECSDVSAVPRRMADFTVDRLPTSGRLTCHYVPPEAAGLHERGQLALPLGERVSGSLTLYDAATGERVAHLGTYVGSFANPRQDVLSRAAHAVRWQPKFVAGAAAAAAGSLDASELIGTLRDGAGRVPRVAEFTQDAPPEDTTTGGRLDLPGETEFWLLGASEEGTGRLFEAFGHCAVAGGGAAGAGMRRFAVADLADPGSIDFGAGLLREAACDLAVVDARTVRLSAAAWTVIRRLLVPGGLVLIRHASEDIRARDTWARLTADGAGDWTLLRADGDAALWAAPAELFDHAPPEPPGPRWVIAGTSQLADMWAWWMAPRAARVSMESMESGWLWSAPAQHELRGLRAVDFFCDDSGAGDPVGERVVARFLEFLRALTVARDGAPHEDPAGPCRVTVVTARAAFDVAAPGGAALHGAVRALGHELEAGIDLRLADAAEPADLTTLRWLATHDVRERELAIRDGRMYAPRLATLPGQGEATAAAAEITGAGAAGAGAVAGSGRYQLVPAAPGQVTGLSMRSVAVPPLGPREVEIDVAAAALNFRDVMVALDMLPLASYERSALGRQIGIEASGTVTRAGAAVTGVQPGDPVIVMTGGCVASSVTVPEAAVFAKPESLSMTQAAAVASVYVTAYYALVDLARLRPGQRVLIHSAMGGVGQAAIALARRAGAVVYATAGTEAKRERLRELGVAAAFDSRSYDWYDELMAATGGAGVHVVLNSLAGRHIALCLEALAPGGWHCEIGKVDIYSDAALGLSVFRKNLRFAAIDVDRLMNDDPAHARELTQACLRLLGDGAVPPLPVTTYPYERYADALRFMASGQHEGKIVLMAPEAAAAGRLRVADRRPFLDPAATYLVTGGFGGLGRHLVAYLVSAGARHLTLLDRDPSRRRDADWVRHASGIAQYFPGVDVDIDIVTADVASREDVDRAVAALTRPLKGVFHLAAVLDDRQLGDITPESVSAVFAPKAGGAWHLHEATLGAPLDHFVLLSSLASVIGNTGQSVYAAANAFLDGLAAYRKDRGLPALAFNMAALAEAGMAARQPHVLRLMRAGGTPPVSVSVAIACLDAALRSAQTIPAPGGIVCADIAQLPGDAGHRDFMRTGRFMRDSAALVGTHWGGAGDGGLTVETVAAELCREIGRLSGHEQVGPRETIASFGVNSVSIAELSAFVRTRFGHQVGILDLMTTATPESVAQAVVSGVSATGDSNGAHATVGRVRSGEIKTAADGDASLPAQCQEDLEFLQRTVRALTSAGAPAPATAPDRVAAVFLTGATGFVGRFVLAGLLRQSPGLVAHCLVRAAGPAEGLERIRRAMLDAEIWDDAFPARIVVHTGDIGEPQFGLDADEFERLAGTVDAVYHLAADLNLMSSYSAVREVNTRSVAHVLELALTQRVKHVVYASTMGVFPQYFCNFAGSFAGMAIEDEATPDIALMRSVLPPGLVGYPWSKLVVEQSLLFARACGVPVAIMRLPQTGIAASTGYTQSSDIKVRIATAVLDTGLAPSGFSTQWTEPVDTVSSLLVRLSLRCGRQHAVYHLVNPSPAVHGLTLADFGLDVREVSYAEFKRACQARGPRGPLHGHWALVDHFAELWFPSDGRAAPTQDRPVATGTVIADLGGCVPEWPGLITTTAQSLGWISRHAADWPYKRPRVSLDAPSLHRQARSFAARLGVDFDDAYPPELLEGLDRLVAAVRTPTARIRPDREAAISFDLSRKLWNRAAVAAEFGAHPEIAGERVERPVFILGINRTGTTLLHRLLARGSRFWAPYPEEIAHPSLPAAGSAGFDRRRYAEDLLTASGVMTAMRGIHAMDAGEPEEEFALLEESFSAWSYTLRFHVPDYARWLARRDAGFAYRVHRQALRHLSWQRGTGSGSGAGAGAARQWLLKMPFHLASLPALAAAYPDAVFVQTHRTPREFLPSWLSLAGSVRALSADVAADAACRAALGAEQLAFMSGMLNGAAALRSADGELDRRFVDVSYLDLVADPVGVAGEIYRVSGWTLDEETRAEMERWHARQAAGRRGERRHRYALGDYGLSLAQVDDAFAGYLEFATANKVRMR